MEWEIPDATGEEIAGHIIELEGSELDFDFDDSIETEILGRIYEKLTDSEDGKDFNYIEKFKDILKGAIYLDKNANTMTIEIRGKRYEVELKINVKEEE